MSSSTDKDIKARLVQRSLGLRHKLKVHESMELPDSHEELARTVVAKWDLEDEMHAIEEILAEYRKASVAEKRKDIEKHGVKAPKDDETPAS